MVPAGRKGHAPADPSADTHDENRWETWAVKPPAPFWETWATKTITRLEATGPLRRRPAAPPYLRTNKVTGKQSPMPASDAGTRGTRGQGEHLELSGGGPATCPSDHVPAAAFSLLTRAFDCIYALDPWACERLKGRGTSFPGLVDVTVEPPVLR